MSITLDSIKRRLKEMSSRSIPTYNINGTRTNSTYDDNIVDDYYAQLNAKWVVESLGKEFDEEFD